jgi:small subunit ribosomal protein S6
MHKKEENLYEGMYVVAANISDEMRKSVIEKIKNGIEENGGEILKEHDMGRRRLAYEIDRHKEGYYILLYFKALPTIVNTLWKEYHITENLLRYITLRTDEVLETLEFKQFQEV